MIYYQWKLIQQEEGWRRLNQRIFFILVFFSGEFFIFINFLVVFKVLVFMFYKRVKIQMFVREGIYSGLVLVRDIDN